MNHALAAERRLPIEPATPSASETSPRGGNLYASLLVTPTLGEMKSLALRTILLEIAAKDSRKLTSQLVAELKSAGFIHVMPEAAWQRARDDQRSLLSQENAAMQRAVAEENKTARDIKKLTDRRDGNWRLLLRALGLGSKMLEREAEEISVVSLVSAKAAYEAKRSEAAFKLRSSRVAHFDTFAKCESGMVALSDLGKQISDDLRNEVDSLFSDFAAGKLRLGATTKEKPPRPPRSEPIRFGTTEFPRCFRSRITAEILG